MTADQLPGRTLLQEPAGVARHEAPSASGAVLARYLDIVSRALAEETALTASRVVLEVPGAPDAGLDRWEITAFVGTEAGQRRSSVVREAVAAWIWCLSERSAVVQGAPAAMDPDQLRQNLARAREREGALARVVESEALPLSARKLGMTQAKLAAAIRELEAAAPKPGARSRPHRAFAGRIDVRQARVAAARASRVAAPVLAMLLPLLLLSSYRAYETLHPRPQIDVEALSPILPLLDARQDGDTFHGTVAPGSYEDLSPERRRGRRAALLAALAPRGVTRVVLEDPFGRPIADGRRFARSTPPR